MCPVYFVTYVPGLHPFHCMRLYVTALARRVRAPA
jgi:hypothetical protein